MFLQGDSVHAAIGEDARRAHARARFFADEMNAVVGALPEGRLFAVYDGAKDDRIFSALLQAQDHVEVQSLYQGQRAHDFRQYCPYLIDLTDQPHILNSLLVLSLGHDWGIYIVASMDFAEMRRVLRKRTMAVLPDYEDPVFFRFYDPRVLPAFLKCSDYDEQENFFGPISDLICEQDRGDTLMTFTLRNKSLINKGIFYRES